MSTLVETLVSYVPALIADRLALDAAPISSPTSESFPAAVLFADISGFTALTEQLADQGSVGAETLTQELNQYFGRMIEIITNFGGDVVKFAGDSLLAIWPAMEEGTIFLRVVTQQAAACALAIQTELKNYQTTDGTALHLRIGLGAGQVAALHIGGIYGRWEFLIAGQPLNQCGQAEAQAQPGEVILSPETWALIDADCLGYRLPNGYVQLHQVMDEMSAMPLTPPVLSAEIETPLRAYIPGAILARLAAGHSDWLAELRRVTVLFINLPNLTDATPSIRLRKRFKPCKWPYIVTRAASIKLALMTKGRLWWRLSVSPR